MLLGQGSYKNFDFIFVCRRRIRNIQKLAPYENFPYTVYKVSNMVVEHRCSTSLWHMDIFARGKFSPISPVGVIGEIFYPEYFRTVDMALCTLWVAYSSRRLQNEIFVTI